MDIPKNIKRFAKGEGFPEVEFVGRWKGLEVYSAFASEAIYVGLPQYILVEGAKLRWASLEETEEIMINFA